MKTKTPRGKTPLAIKPKTERRKRSTMSQNDTFEFFAQRHVFIPQRLIILTSEHTNTEWDESGTDSPMFLRLKKGLEILQHLGPNAPITIIMNNPGGIYEHGMAIYSAIKNCRCPIAIEATGYIASMGSIILQAATTRLVTRDARLLLHYPEHTLTGRHIEDLSRQFKEAQEMNEVFDRIYLSRIKKRKPEYSHEMLRHQLVFDWNLSASEAVEWGLADSIIKKTSTIRDIATNSNNSPA